MGIRGKILPGLVIAMIQASGFAQNAPTRLVVAIDENEFLPYYQARADGKVSGFARDLLDRFAHDEGFQLEYQVYPLNRLQLLQLQRRVDLRFPDSPLWAGMQKKPVQIFYSRPVVAYVDGIHCQPGRVAKVNGGLFSILRGFTPLGFAGLIRERKVRFIEAPNFKAALAMHYRKRVDGVYGNEAVLMKLSQEHYGERLVIQSQYPVTRDSYRLSSSKHKAVIARFDRWYSEKKKGIDALLASYQLSSFRP